MERSETAMIKLAIYGKGGIGKSTIASNLSAVYAEQGLSVMQIGCDPKADSTIALHGNAEITTVLDLIRSRGNNDFTLDEMMLRGYRGIACVEAGGPTPGLGCAGRGIITALEALKNKGAYETVRPDIIIYDVLGDVVCGGFSTPMRRGYADTVYIVTSGENMAIHAAANIAVAIENFRGRGYASLGGLILNRRSVPREDEKTAELAADIHTSVIGAISRSEIIQNADSIKKTVIEAFPESEAAAQYRALASAVYGNAIKRETNAEKNKW